MTFKELFESTVKELEGKKYEGRTCAIDSVTCSLRDAFEEEAKKTNWTTSFCTNPYGNCDPYFYVAAHGCYRTLPFKVRLKKAGVKESYYGNITYYTPVVAFLTNEDMMDMEIVDVLNSMYNQAEDIKEHIAKEEEITKKKLEYKGITDKLTSVINEFNELPLDVKQLLRGEIPHISFYC